MALHERHAACVDARGDVYQWGNGFFGSKADAKGPKITLRGKVGTKRASLSSKIHVQCLYFLQNIIKVQLTDSRVYALSASGRIYVFAANEEQQQLPKLQTSSATPWGLSGWIGREQQAINFVEICPKEKLNWCETLVLWGQRQSSFRQLTTFLSFTSIVAGNNHLLALTSEGRTYAHPVNKDANSHGQLGLRKIEIPAPLSLHAGHSRIAIDLVPRFVAHPHTKTPPLLRESSPSVASEHLNVTDDRHIGFSDLLFEIPSLRGVKVSQIAAGGRSSFVNTISGRVLGWGANEHG